MGLRSRRKGADGERSIVSLARQHGLTAERTWHTAQASDSRARCCDARIAGLAAQVKIAADGFTTLYAALDGVEIAFLRSDRREWLVVLRADRFFELLGEKGKEGREGDIQGIG